MSEKCGGVYFKYGVTSSGSVGNKVVCACEDTLLCNPQASGHYGEFQEWMSEPFHDNFGSSHCNQEGGMVS